MISYNEKCGKLLSALDIYTDKDVMIAFSGGVDSSLLLNIACDFAKKKGTKVFAVTVHTELHPINDLEIAKRVAKEFGAIHCIVKMDELKEAGIGNNPVNRCYLCKKCLFTKLKEMAEEEKIEYILEGTNEDDQHVYRPGIQALKELQIKSPLADAMMEKEDIRKFASEYQISVANRPSAPCLATRFPYGTMLSYELMQKVEAGEEYIRGLGLYNIRLRIHDEIVRIEVDQEDITNLVANKDCIISYLKNLGFVYITVDLEGFRSGSMDLHIDQDK